MWEPSGYMYDVICMDWSQRLLKRFLELDIMYRNACLKSPDQISTFSVFHTGIRSISFKEPCWSLSILYILPYNKCGNDWEAKMVDQLSINDFVTNIEND